MSVNSPNIDSLFSNTSSSDKTTVYFSSGSKKLYKIAILIIIITAFGGIFWYLQNLNTPQKKLSKAIQEYKNLDLLKISSQGLDTLFSHREDLVSRALEAGKDLSSGNKEQALAKLQKIKKLIEGQTRANKAGGINLDNNDNGVEDYIEPFHSEIINIIKQAEGS